MYHSSKIQKLCWFKWKNHNAYENWLWINLFLIWFKPI